MLLSNHDEYLVLYKYYFVSDSSTFFLFSSLALHPPYLFTLLYLSEKKQSIYSFSSL